MRYPLGRLALHALTTAVLTLACKGELTVKPSTYTLSGFVTDRHSGLAVSGCVVSVQGKEDEADAAGHYQLQELESGSYTLKFRHADYYVYTADIDIGQADKTFSATLEDKFVPCPDLISPADGYTVEATGMFDPDSIVMTWSDSRDAARYMFRLGESRYAYPMIINQSTTALSYTIYEASLWQMFAQIAPRDTDIYWWVFAVDDSGSTSKLSECRRIHVNVH